MREQKFISLGVGKLQRMIYHNRFSDTTHSSHRGTLIYQSSQEMKKEC